MNGFEPKNALEEDLIAAQEGRLDGEQFLRSLLASQVFMPVREKHAVAGFQSSDKAVPVMLQSEDQAEYVVLFTSPERAGAFVRQIPDCHGGLLAEFTWILEKTGLGIGLTLNPGLEAGMELAPEMVQQLVSG